jgi:branched-chain amino acid transport system substrate-binding protein
MKSHRSGTSTALKSVILAALAACLLLTASSFAQDEPASIRIGYAVSKTGANAGGAGTTTIPNYELWVHDVNERGGIFLSSLGRSLPLEVIEYDDRSSSEEAVRAIERLISQDKVDFILPPWGTGLNLAVGPLLNRAGYPHMAATSVTDKAPELAKRWDNAFFFLGTSTQGAEALAELLVGLRDEGKIGSRVAMAAASDEFGIELSTAARRVLKDNNFELTYDRAYPLGTQDMQPILTDAARGEPDVFIAFSYPPDTLALTEAAQLLDFNPTVFYTAVGTAFPIFKQRFDANADGVMGIGGVDSASPLIQEYLQRHLEVTGAQADQWASANTYASLQVLEQAIERVGSLDRAAVIKDIQSGTFDTILGNITLQDNMLTDLWWVGQWQDGEFKALAPLEREGVATPVVPKPHWQK